MKLLFEHEKATLAFNEDTNAIELCWKTFQDEQTYKLMFSKGLEYLKQHKATSWFSDIRNEGVVGPNSSKWLQQEIIPKAVAAGLKKIAIIMNTDVFKTLYVNNLKKSVNEKEFIKYFDSIENANNWLKEN